MIYFISLLLLGYCLDVLLLNRNVRTICGFLFFVIFGEAVFSRLILRGIFLSQKVTRFCFYLEDSSKKKKVLKKSRL